MVRHQEDALGRDAAFAPQIEQIVAQGFRGQHVERRKRLVEQQDVGVDDQRAGKTDPLPHAARQFLGIGVFEPVKADQVDRIDRLPPPVRRPDAQRLEAKLDIAEHGQPREQRKALKHHRHAVHRFENRLAAIFDGAVARRHETGENAQKRRFARTRLAEHRDDLAFGQREIEMVEHQPPDMVGRPVGLAQRRGAQQRGLAGDHRGTLPESGAGIN